MPILLTVPPGVTSHTPGVRLQATKKLTKAERREIADRFIATQQDYTGAPAFAAQESARLATLGVTWLPSAIIKYVLRARVQGVKVFQWERVLAQLRTVNPRTKTYWHDPGDLCAAAGITTIDRLAKAFGDLRRFHEVEIRRRRPSWGNRQSRGWEWEYRVWEAPQDRT